MTRGSRLTRVFGIGLSFVAVVAVRSNVADAGSLGIPRLSLPAGGGNPPASSPADPAPPAPASHPPICAGQPPTVEVTAPQGSDFTCRFNMHEPVPMFIEHFALENFLSWEFTLRRPGPLTLTGGVADLLDEDGNAIATPLAVSVARLEQVIYSTAFGIPLEGVGLCRADATIACKLAPDANDPNPCDATGDPACDPRPAGFVPADFGLDVLYPRELIGHNLVPASSQIALCFDEFRTGSGDCDPFVARMPHQEYRSPRGQTYIHPMVQPTRDLDGDGVPEADRITGGAHEIGKGHRRARNQRYTYDLITIAGQDGPDWDPAASDAGGSCADPDTGDVPKDNERFFGFDEPIVAMADGVVVTLEQGHPDNPCVPDVLPGAGKCVSRTCAGGPSDGSGNDKCTVNDPSDPLDDVFPGSGTSLILFHDPAFGGNGEYTGYAHLVEGSNDHLSCGSFVRQGEQIGRLGNSGGSSGPHLHFSSLVNDGPEDPGQHAFPSYYTNVWFTSPGASRPRRQLDVAIRSRESGQHFQIVDPPTPLSRNVPAGPGNAAEREPNDTLAQHDALELPVVVSATLENADVGDLAVRGDGIEDVFRFDVAAPDSIRVELEPASASGNLDVYVLTEDLRVMNPTREGTRPAGSEQVCLGEDHGEPLAPGAYYVMVTNDDRVRAAAVDYQLTIESDPQTIACAVTNEVQPVAVDESCEAEVEFEIAIHDTCCLSEETLALDVRATNPTDNATVGEPVIDSIVFTTGRDAVVKGRVPVSAVESCPAEVRIEASANDCAGNPIDTAPEGTGCFAEVIDDTPPEVSSGIAAGLLWPPDHELVGVGFTRAATDNCDTGIGQSLATTVWSDEAEMSVRGVPFSPDASGANGNLRLRREREARGDGRVYLALTAASDTCGNADWSCAVSGVPRDQSEASIDSLDGQAGTALGVCETSGAPPAGFLQQGVSPAIGPKQ